MPVCGLRHLRLVISQPVERKLCGCRSNEYSLPVIWMRHPASRARASSAGTALAPGCWRGEPISARLVRDAFGAQGGSRSPGTPASRSGPSRWPPAPRPGLDLLGQGQDLGLGHRPERGNSRPSPRGRESLAVPTRPPMGGAMSPEGLRWRYAIRWTDELGPDLAGRNRLVKAEGVLPVRAGLRWRGTGRSGHG